MLTKLDTKSISTLTNPQFRRYAEIYQGIYAQFCQQVEAIGLPMAPYIEADETLKCKKHLEQQGALLRNGMKSIYLNRISPACQACKKGVGSFTTFISLACHRNCYFCFNPNQEDYEYHRKHKQDVTAQLAQLLDEGVQISHLALTGGEPLLHPHDVIKFFQYAHDHSPVTHTRLYTSGDQLNEELLKELQDAHLQEIRFSIKMEDPTSKRNDTLDRITLAQQYIPTVMVEMPVIPQYIEEMKELLLKLDALQIFGINLLELCFPFHNVPVFKEKGFQVKNPPCEILYNYWYAGGLPVAGSEEAALSLIQFAMDRSLQLGIHYCSFENKLTGQVYQQNALSPYEERYTLSDRDFFLKSAKVFGSDVPLVLSRLKEYGHVDYIQNDEWDYLEFSIRYIPLLQDLDVEIGISSYIKEMRPEGPCLRELSIDLTHPASFNLEEDI